jgi:pimeloyl-ACP methyl ester carboxylesterase
MNMNEVALSKTRIGYLDTQTLGPPLVLLHGVLRCHQDFVPLLPELAFRHRCLAVDQRGHGQSTQVTGEYRVSDYTQDAAEFIQQTFPDQQVILFGHSLGAMVAAEVAAQWPEHISAIILEDPPFQTMGKRIETTPLASYFRGVREAIASFTTTQDLARKLAEINITDPVSGNSWKLADVRDEPTLRFAAACLGKVDPTVLDPICAGKWLDGYDELQTFASIACPVLALQADPAAGGMLVDEDLQQMRDTISDFQHVRFPSAGHLLHWSHREALMQSVNAFLESLQ